MEKKEYKIILFETVSQAMKAEKILKASGIPFKLIPIPKEVSPDCGICLRFTADCEEGLRKALEGQVEILRIASLDDEGTWPVSGSWKG